MSNQRKKVILAAAGSLGLHVVLLLVWALTVQWLPGKGGTALAPPPKPIKVTIEEATPEPVMVAVSTPPPVRFLDTSNMREAASPPPDTDAESGKNTVDASELPPTGTQALPSQAGTKNTVFAIETHEFVDGEARGDAPPTSQPPPETAPPLPRAVAQPKPVAVAAPTPRPEGFAMMAPQATPTGTAEPEANPYDPSVRSTDTAPPLPTPILTFGRSRGTYQPQQTKTAISGSINNRGPSSVASMSTPTGRYQAAVLEAIGRRYNRYVANRSDLAALGSVHIHFLVGMDGHTRQMEVVTNTANEALASISLQAITDAAIPPMPADAIPDTGGGQLPVDIIFEFLD